jgi:TolB-like protein
VLPSHQFAESRTSETAQSLQGQQQADPIALSGRPSIIVLPFANLSGISEEDYLSNGFSEDIVTELSRFSELQVIAWHSSFHYKGKAVDERQVGRELGVDYVLQGSVRRGNDRVRITAQLVDAETGAHLWGEHYDRNLDNVFAIEDEVVRTIALLLVAHVRKAEVERTLLKPSATWQAYHYFMRGLDLHLAYQSSQEVAVLHEARRLLETSISIDPAYARPYSALAVSHLSSWTNYGDGDFLRPSELERAHQFARQAVQLDPQLAYAQATFAHVLTWGRQHEVALFGSGPSSKSELLPLPGGRDPHVRRRGGTSRGEHASLHAARPLLSDFGHRLARRRLFHARSFVRSATLPERGGCTQSQARHVSILAGSRVRTHGRGRCRPRAGESAPQAATILYHHRHRSPAGGLQESFAR